MTASARAADWRLSAFFATYFATVGVFAPYFPLYLQARGLSALDIGIVLAMMQGMRAVGPNLWGYLADRSAERRRILRWTAVAACLAFVPILLPGGFALVFAVMFAVSLFLTAQIPVAEAITASHLQADAQSATRYGRLRVWGSAGFIAVVLAAGALFDAVGVQWQPVVGLALLAACGWAAFMVRDAAVPEPAQAKVSIRARLRQARVQWFFLSVALMVFAHGALYTYFSLYLALLGYSKALIGLFWVVGVLAEIVFFFTQGRLFARFGVFRLLAASFVLAAVRFALVAQFAHVWALLLLAQLLHAASFAVHHSATILTIQQWFPGSAAARGQALYISIGYGIGGSAGALVAAALWTTVGPSAAFLASSAAAVAGWWAVQRARSVARLGDAAAAA
jgi:PPP family 3-phenylpropionic acid transporter